MSRAITTESIEAFNNNEAFNKSNTIVTVEHYSTRLFLFGNCIATRTDGVLWITNCGWETVTTKERLNGLEGVSINQSKGVWYLNGKAWDGSLIKIK